MFLLSVNFSISYAEDISTEPTAKRDNSAEIRQAVENYFKKEKYNFSGFDEKNVASTSFSIKSKLSSVNIILQARNNYLSVRSILPIKANEDTRLAVAEYLLRANYGMKIGGFDFDFNDGEISFRASFFCGNVAPTYEQIDIAIEVCLAMTKRYGDGIIKVIYGFQSPKEAIQEIENK